MLSLKKKWLGVGLGAAMAGIIATGTATATYSLTGVIFDGAGQRYRMVAGVIRQDSTGSGWYLITGGHKPVNLTVNRQDGASVYLDFPDTVHVISMICGPDETYAQKGVICGASVGLNYVQLKFGKNGQALDPRTLNTANDGPYANFWVQGWVEG